VSETVDYRTYAEAMNRIESLQEEVGKLKGYRDECERQYQEKTEALEDK